MNLPNGTGEIVADSDLGDDWIKIDEYLSSRFDGYNNWNVKPGTLVSVSNTYNKEVPEIFENYDRKK